MRGSHDEQVSVIDEQDAEISALQQRVAKLEGEVAEATDRLLRARKVALDGVHVRHVVFQGWAYRAFNRILNIIENKEET